MGVFRQFRSVSVMVSDAEPSTNTSISSGSWSLALRARSGNSTRDALAGTKNRARDVISCRFADTPYVTRERSSLADFAPTRNGIETRSRVTATTNESSRQAWFGL